LGSKAETKASRFVAKKSNPKVELMRLKLNAKVHSILTRAIQQYHRARVPISMFPLQVWPRLKLYFLMKHIYINLEYGNWKIGGCIGKEIWHKQHKQSCASSAFNT
jgi:hypothetical protein